MINLLEKSKTHHRVRTKSAADFRRQAQIKTIGYEPRRKIAKLP